MKKYALVFLPVAVALVVGVVIILTSGSSQDETTRQVSPTVSNQPVKKKGSEDAVGARSDADKARRQEKASSTELSGSREATSRTPLKRSAALNREMMRALNAAPAGESFRKANSALKRQGARRVSQIKREGKLLTLYRLKSGKLYLVVMRNGNQVLMSAEATPQNR